MSHCYFFLLLEHGKKAVLLRASRGYCSSINNNKYNAKSVWGLVRAVLISGVISLTSEELHGMGFGPLSLCCLIPHYHGG